MLGGGAGCFAGGAGLLGGGAGCFAGGAGLSEGGAGLLGGGAGCFAGGAGFGGGVGFCKASTDGGLTPERSLERRFRPLSIGVAFIERRSTFGSRILLRATAETVSVPRSLS